MGRKKRVKVVAVKVSFVLDETGSMQSYKDTTMSSFNEYVEGLRKQKNLSMTLTKFNSEKVEIVYKDLAIKDVPKLNNDTYQPDACTPLYDAIGRTIGDLKGEKKMLMIVLSDGLENASKEYTQKQIFDLIKQKEKEGWTFVYLGSNQDAWAASSQIGFKRGNTVSYDQKKTKQTYRALGEATQCYAASGGEATGKFFEDGTEEKLL